MDKLHILQAYLKTKLGKGNRFRSREQLLAWQDKQVRRFIRKIVRKSPFYKQYYEGHDLADWRNLPMVDKSIMMTHFDELNTLGIRKDEAFDIALRAEESRDFAPMIGGVTVGLSSGTSGNRGLFLVSPKERNAWAGTILAKMLPGSILSEHKIAFFLRANSNLYNTVQSGGIQFEYFDLLDPLDDHLQRLEQFRPSVVIAPPSMLRLLAEAKQRDQLSIVPTKIMSVAEVLDPLDEAIISEQFEQVVHQVYQCTEGLLAVTCAYGRLHINEDILAVQCEFLDEAKSKFMPIITDFSRTTQPVIRYKLNDILTLDTSPCKCGSVHMSIQSIEGRCDDMFSFVSSDGEGDVAVFPDFIRRAVMASSDSIEEYKVIQHSRDVIEVSIKASVDNYESLEHDVRARFSELCHRLHCVPPVITFSPLMWTVGPQKLRRVEQRMRRTSGGGIDE